MIVPATCSLNRRQPLDRWRLALRGRDHLGLAFTPCSCLALAYAGAGIRFRSLSDSTGRVIEEGGYSSKYFFGATWGVWTEVTDSQEELSIPLFFKQADGGGRQQAVATPCICPPGARAKM